MGPVNKEKQFRAMTERLWIAFILMLLLESSSCYEIGCVYPERMPEPFVARGRLVALTDVYSPLSGLETPMVVHKGLAFSYCGVNCLAHHDSAVLNAFDMARPRLVVPPEIGHNSWSRMMCIAQCYAVFIAKAGNKEAIQTLLLDEWQLPIRPSIEPEIKENFDNDYDAVVEYITSGTSITEEVQVERQFDVTFHAYDPLKIGRLVAHEINVKMAKDGWNRDGGLAFDFTTGEAATCTANCVKYRDTYGYIPRNWPQIIPPDEKYNITGNRMYWQPLMEDDGLGFMFRQEHVVPHIGFNAQFKLRDPSTKSLPDPEYKYYEESLLVLNRLKDAATDLTKWDKITFYDKKFLVRILIQTSMRRGFRRQYRFEDELMFIYGISVAEHDAVLHAWREKVLKDLVRPTTVIQQWGNDEVETFDGNFKSPGVATIKARDFQAFVRVMPHSEYPSGSSCICTAYQEFTDAFTSRYLNTSNLTNIFWGFGGVDIGCFKGHAPSELLGCKHTGGFEIGTMLDLARECGQSRLWGGMHFTASVPAGEELCRGLGELGLGSMREIINESTFGKTHSQRDERPVCSLGPRPSPPPTTIPATPQEKPTTVPSANKVDNTSASWTISIKCASSFYVLSWTVAVLSL